jgi:UDP-glucose 4-epimerase
MSKNENEIVLVTGATGAIGPSVVRILNDANLRVRTLSTTPPQPNLLSPEVEIFTGDVTDPDTVAAAVRDVDAIIHLAGLLHILNPTDSLREQYERVNVTGTKNLMAASLAGNVRRFVFVSTIAVYAYGTGEVLNEETTPHPSTPYAESKLRAERIVLEGRRDGHPIGTVLRLAAVYGSRVKGNYRRLLYSLARRRFVPLGSGANRRTLVHDSDVARAAMLALTCPNAAGRIFNVSDGTFHTLNDIVATICQALGRRRPSLTLPVRPAHIAAGILEDMQRLVGRNPKIGRSTIDKYTEDVAVDSTRIQRELGFVPQMNLAAGWAQTIREMRADGDL